MGGIFDFNPAWIVAAVAVGGILVQTGGGIILQQIIKRDVDKLAATREDHMLKLVDHEGRITRAESRITKLEVIHEQVIEHGGRMGRTEQEMAGLRRRSHDANNVLGQHELRISNLEEHLEKER